MVGTPKTGMGSSMKILGAAAAIAAIVVITVFITNNVSDEKQSLVAEREKQSITDNEDAIEEASEEEINDLIKEELVMDATTLTTFYKAIKFDRKYNE